MTGKDIHVVPVGDKKEHEMHRQCWCRPHLEWQAYDVDYYTTPAVVIHNSLDRREDYEQCVH